MVEVHPVDLEAIEAAAVRRSEAKADIVRPQVPCEGRFGLLDPEAVGGLFEGQGASFDCRPGFERLLIERGRRVIGNSEALRPDGPEMALGCGLLTAQPA